MNARWRAWAVRHRVHIGILIGLVYVAFSRPSPSRFWIGVVIVALGEGIRVWACGFLIRNKVLTRGGPYSLVRHPLYAGSLLIGVGLAILAEHPLIWLGAFGLLYVTMYLPAMYVEELRLQSLFGAEYKEYMEEIPRLLPRWRLRPEWPDETRPAARFSSELATANREIRTVAVMAALLLLQWLKFI